MSTSSRPFGAARTLVCGLLRVAIAWPVALQHPPRVADGSDRRGARRVAWRLRWTADSRRAGARAWGPTGRHRSFRSATGAPDVARPATGFCFARSPAPGSTRARMPLATPLVTSPGHPHRRSQGAGSITAVGIGGAHRTLRWDGRAGAPRGADPGARDRTVAGLRGVTARRPSRRSVAGSCSGSARSRRSRPRSCRRSRRRNRARSSRPRTCPTRRCRSAWARSTADPT